MSSGAWKIAHRVVVLLILVVVLAIVALHLVGTITPRDVGNLFLTIELPLILAALIIAGLRVWALRRETGKRGADLYNLIQAEEPALRAAITEARTLLSILTLVRGRKNGVQAGILGFSYSKGTLAVPIVLTVVTVAETALIHFLVPWGWLRIVLLFAAVYALVLVFGVLASRVVNPHLVGGGRLALKWGQRAVLDTPLSNISSAEVVSHLASTQPAIEGDRLLLAAMNGANVRISLFNPEHAHPPISKRRIPDGYSCREILLYVAEPQALVRAIRPSGPCLKWSDGSLS